MDNSKKSYGICGVYCGQCPSGNGRIRFAAGELKRLIDTTRFDWMEEIVKSFRFSEFRKGLEWFNQVQCPGCNEGGGAPCKNRPCAKERGLESCLLCEEYMKCPNTTYQRETYPFVIENYNRVKEVGFEQHLLEEEKKALAGVDLMGHLERKYCKLIPLE
jgi:hypothetical protein